MSNAVTPSISEADVIKAIRELRSNASFQQLYQSLTPADRLLYYQQTPLSSAEDKSEAILDVLLNFCGPSEMHEQLERHVLTELREGVSDEVYADYEKGANKIMEIDKRLVKTFRDYGRSLPLSIWHCCKRGCFATLVADGEQFLVFDEVMTIHQIAKSFRERIGDVSSMVQTRRRGVGGSTVAQVFPSRGERDPSGDTDRQKTAAKLYRFVQDVLPFLCGVSDSRTGVPMPKRKLCVNAISSILGVSNNLIYKRRHAIRKPSHRVTNDQASSDEVLSSILDSAGVRMRQHRREGKRIGYPEVNDLPNFQCGCDENCFADAPLERLHEWYNNFSKLAQQFHSRRKENQFLLNIMLCPLLNRTISICNNALSALFTVSPGKIANVRGILNSICDDPSLDTQEIIEREAIGYRYSPRHPIKRYDPKIRAGVEIYLDKILRPDPGASDGVNVCRVYSPEINTQEKLRILLAKELKADEIVTNPLSDSTLQRLIGDYLKERNCSISFTQSDHNACPSCKTMKYGVLQYSRERKFLAGDLEALKAKHKQRPFDRAIQERYDVLVQDLEAKTKQEDMTLEELNHHTARDARIRGFLKTLTDFFRNVENIYLESEKHLSTPNVPIKWCQRNDHAILTHQDDMSKVDLPSFIVTGTSDITRWRYDVNAHVNAVNGECVVFSHEQGGGPKNSSAIMELILLDHILRCRGEGVKFVVSDNAAVGKNWLTTIALPQYMVDQGLAEIVVVVFLENNHGKWLADMLFGQLQLRRRRSTIPGIDALLSEFESIKKTNGSIQGFALNPLASIDFATVLESLGYRTKPLAEFAFVKRDIHFATACKEGVKDNLPSDLLKLIGEMLPDDAGMVRICREPPHGRPQNSVRFENRYFDVPAALDADFAESACLNQDEVPLVVPLGQPFAPGGACVVSKRNMDQVGYNGFAFRKYKAYPELRNNNDPLVRETWPPGLVNLPERESEVESNDDSEKLKCAPDSWIVRRPVGRFRTGDGEIVARYPPRNMLNAKFENGPRDEVARGSLRWKQTKTYEEPPFPLKFKESRTNTSALSALQNLQREQEFGRDVNVLDLLRCIFREMGDREQVSDPWLQQPVTRPSSAAQEKYRNELQLYAEREKGYPKAPKTMRQVFREDPSVKERVASIRREAASAGNSETAAAITSRLFKEAAKTPGALDRYELLAAKDLERFSWDLRQFKEGTQKEFDERHDLTPIPCELPDGAADI